MTYTLKHKIVSWVSKNLFDNLTYTVRNGINKGLKRRGGLAWVPMEQPTAESDFWQALDCRNLVVYDIGAFHGLLTIYFARQAKQVIAFEPNSQNRRRLEQNISLNGFHNVLVRPYGLSSVASTAQMTFDPLAPGTASIDSGIAWGGEVETIEIRTLDSETGIPAPDLVKIDVEGFELEVLKGATQTLATRPALFLEMHGSDAEDKRKRVEAIVAHLWQLGYRDILHVESRTAITPENAAKAARGHLYLKKG